MTKFSQVTPHSPHTKGQKLYIIKVGGNIIDAPEQLSLFLQSLAALKEKVVLVHGGGKLATQLAQQLNLPQQMVEGRRITDTETLKIVTMVYAGYINKNMVAQLQGFGCTAVGFCGADGNAVSAHKRVQQKEAVADWGYVGDIDSVNEEFFIGLLQQNLMPVVAPITHDKKGQLLNTNADTLAQEIATALSSSYQTILVYCFEKKGVLENAGKEDSVIAKINKTIYQSLKQNNRVFAGMIPKLDNAFAAIDKGVQSVVIGQAEELNQIILGRSGTVISHE